MRAYCQDLRERIVSFVDEGNLLKDAVETFHVSPSCVQGLLRRRDETGQFAAKPHRGGNPGRFTPEDLATLRRLSEEQPDAYLRELADRLEAAGGPRVTESTICKRLQELGLTRKKKDLHAAEQDTPEVQAQREAFCHELADIDPRSLVFLDESGVNQGMTRRFARSPRGTRATASAPVNVGCNLSIAAAIRLEEGVVAAMTLEGAFDGETFLAFVRELLAPTLRPGDHVVLDNLGAHRTRGVVEAIEAVGAHVLPMPPYSPDLNPIEEFWSFFKEGMRAQAARSREALETAIVTGIEKVTPRQLLGWFKNSGYV